MKKILFFIIFFFCVAALVFLSVRKYEERKKDVAFRNEINSYLYNRGEGEFGWGRRLMRTTGISPIQ
ncbi:MAG: hypothetical protein UW95_C0022G0002 [Parcubacteria group bacterium GW2011_GWC1_45_14]|nr:MAG: hypothetical protein UW95_C0022G0002 [Parcubacteria group bacterium GW2011_GWC1_45_14]